MDEGTDVDKLSKEKQDTEARLLQVEQEFKKQQDFQEKAKAREVQLEKEIEELKIQLKSKEENDAKGQWLATQQTEPETKPVSFRKHFQHKIHKNQIKY